MAKGVDKASFENRIKSGAFLVGESGVLAIGFWIGEVDFGVGDIQIAAEKDGLFFFEIFAIREKINIPLEGAVIEAAGAFVLVVVL